MDHLVALMLLLSLGWFWLDALRARELAVVLAGRACDERGLQFLDQAVALRRMGLRWTRDGLRFRRVYRFDWSDGGVGRSTGTLVLVGLTLAELSLGLPTAPADA